jgi:8-oxo-dGTP pyrophosphatase MutT (NUDIX family)
VRDEARPASTVLVLREGSDGIEVYLQRRPQRMHFAGGLWVFPGGRVDDADRDPAIDAHWAGPPPDAWATVMDVDVELARGHVVAAYREVLEESGILLSADSPPADAVADARRALLDGGTTFAAVTADLGLRLDTRLLGYWDWWVTPASEPRRYDTRFFLARLPGDAVVTPHQEEVVEETWAGDTALDALPMIAPTYCTMRDAVAHRSLDAAMAAATGRTIAATQPVIEDGDVVLPWDERFRLPDGFGGAG